MGIRKRLAGLTNMVLKPCGAQIVNRSEEKPWDFYFKKWISEAQPSAKDPNDIGDMDWSNDPLKEALAKYYLPYIHPDSIVLELGPGTGRATRHVISCCREMILVDYSRMVCEWLQGYLRGKGQFRVCHIDKPCLAMIRNGVVDAAFANGVFEHIDADDLFCFLEELARVLKPGGTIAFNFNNIMSEEGLEWFQKHRGEPGSRWIFRFYHPDVVSRLAEAVGLQILDLATSQSRFAYMVLRKPAC